MNACTLLEWELLNIKIKRSLCSNNKDSLDNYSVYNSPSTSYPKLLKKVDQRVPVTPTAIKTLVKNLPSSVSCPSPLSSCPALKNNDQAWLTLIVSKLLKSGRNTTGQLSLF